MLLRTVLIATLIGSATAVPAAPAHAVPPATNMAAARRPESVLPRSRPEAQVAAFFRDYRLAVLRRGGRPRAVRLMYLTSRLNKTLDRWAKRHGADPVFRAHTVPGQWSVRYEGTAVAAGYCTVVLTERWGSRTARDLVFQVRLPDLRIMDLDDST